jgi:hypothetical protein
MLISISKLGMDALSQQGCCDTWGVDTQREEFTFVQNALTIATHTYALALLRTERDIKRGR